MTPAAKPRRIAAEGRNRGGPYAAYLRRCRACGVTPLPREAWESFTKDKAWR